LGCDRRGLGRPLGFHAPGTTRSANRAERRERPARAQPHRRLRLQPPRPRRPRARAGGRTRRPAPPRLARPQRHSTDSRRARRILGPTPHPTPTSAPWTACWPPRATANAGSGVRLDLARYADTNGFQGDPERTMWPWRDWVVNALNANMPFDQFTLEATRRRLVAQRNPGAEIASGFHRNNMFNGEGGRIAEETRVEQRLRSRRNHRHGLARRHLRLRPLPRPQVRSLHAARLLRPVRHLQPDVERPENSGGGGQVAPVLDVGARRNSPR
jgi:hypothetical protein